MVRFLSPIVIATGPLRVAPFAHPRVVHAYSRLAHSVLRTPGKAVAPTNGAACSMVVTVVVPEMAEKNSEESFACAGDPETEGSSGYVYCHVRYGSRPGETRNWPRELEPCSSATGSSSKDGLSYPLPLRVEGGRNCPLCEAARSIAAHRSSASVRSRDTRVSTVHAHRSP